LRFGDDQHSVPDTAMGATIMIEQGSLTRANLKTPKAAAIAGIVFSILLILVFWLLRNSISGHQYWLGLGSACVRGQQIKDAECERWEVP
jgi:hypothetical protein